MIERRYTRLGLLALLALVCYYTFFHNTVGTTSTPEDKDDYSDVVPRQDKSGLRRPLPMRIYHPVNDEVDHTSNYVPNEDDFRVIYSQTTKDRKYFHINFAGAEVFNPNIIPHPAHKNKWIVVAQSGEYRDDIGSSEQLVCIAEFVDGVLHCSKWPSALQIATSITGECTGELAFTNMRRGPRDARVFYGPEQPYIIYGSQSSLSDTCLGLWVQNLWMLLDGAKHPNEGFASKLTEIQRPKPWGQIQKNYFLFWDDKDRLLAHYDIYPQRAFALLKNDGSAAAAVLKTEGLDLAQFSRDHDQKCMDRLFPKIEPDMIQGIHQATNTLSITLCKRAENCPITNNNTFILHIMQHKNFFEWQGIYNPYPILFQRTEPYALHAVATKPLFYHGKDLLTEQTRSNIYRDRKDWPRPKGHTVMHYTTSISWKDHSQTYHGYLDDVLMIAFGIEDTFTGGIDVLASDILQDLGYC